MATISTPPQKGKEIVNRIAGFFSPAPAIQRGLSEPAPLTLAPPQPLSPSLLRAIIGRVIGVIMLLPVVAAALALLLSILIPALFVGFLLLLVGVLPFLVAGLLVLAGEEAKSPEVTQ